MNDPERPDLESEEFERENIDVQDDAVIGRAFRGSLAVLAVVGVLALAVIWWLNRPEEAAPEQVIEVAAPERVERSGEPPVAPFTDVTAEAGITFVHDSGAYGDKLLPETMGSGVAVLDYDNDGDPDLLFANGTAWPHRQGDSSPSTPKLYANDGQGAFTDVTAAAGLDRLSFYGTGVAAADIDGDGWRDLFLTAVGENRLLMNREGRFEETTAQAGVAGGAEDWSTGAGFFDYDGDGDLDLFVANYVIWSKEIDFEQKKVFVIR